MRSIFLAVVAIAFCQPALGQDADSCEDPRLSEAAATLLVDGDETAASLDDAARLSRSNAVGLRMVRAMTSSASLATLLAEAREREGALVRCGEAEANGVVVRIVGREGARLSTALTATGVVLDVELVANVSRASLEVRAVDGTSFRREIDPRTRRVPLPDGFPVPFVAQVVGSAGGGPRPIAVLAHGTPVRDEATDETLETHVERVRRLASAPELRANAILGEVARVHAAAVCRERRAAHVLSDGDPVARVRRAGLEARSVGEVVARAATLPEALAAIDASPSHRLALEDPAYTDAGSGTVVGEDGFTCVVVVLASWPRFAGH